MQMLGILAGLVSAVLQSCSYIASAVFLRRHGSPRDMLFYSQAVQFLFAVPILLAFAPEGALADAHLLMANAFWLIIFTITQFSMFAAQRTVEPSKIATWLGLKIVVLAVLTTFWPINGESVSALKWLAIAITISAVWLLNQSGGMKPGWRGAFYLALLIGVSSLCDRQQVLIIGEFRKYGAGLFASSVLTLALGYATFGVFAIGYLIADWRRLLSASPHGRGERMLSAFNPSVAREVWGKLRDSFPFAAFWFSAMMCIYFCYGELGPVFGNVVQSTRSVIAVVIGILAARLFSLGVETPVSRSMWMRRLIAAALMSVGIILYSCL